MTKIYLAGGFKSNWQNKLPVLPNFEYFNPAIKEANKELKLEEYVAWDLHHILKSDIVFVNIENSNPSCIGLAAEIGYAKAMNKTIITIIEPNNPYFKDRYFDFLRGLSSVTYNNIEEGIMYIIKNK